MIPINKRRCRSCAFSNPDQKICNLTQHGIDLDQDYCSRFNDNPIKCTFCGIMLLAPIVEQINDNCYYLCPQCSESIGTCATCANGNPRCRFQTDQSTIPLYTVIQRRQGNTIIQEQIHNPERERVTCALGCSCWNAVEKCCCREQKQCGNYTFNNSLLPVISQENS